MKNKTVLITGASSGIGRALVYEFAKAGYNIVAIARNKEALTDLATQCQLQYGAKIFFLVKDLADKDALSTILGYLHDRHLQITSLVNNAGFGVWGRFDKSNLEDELRLITLHITFYLKLTKALLPQMIEKNEGEILNVGSVYSFTPVPYQSVYGASKSFLLSHTLALRQELKGTGINVSITCPGLTMTAFRKSIVTNEKPSFVSMTAEKVAKISFRQFQAKKAIIIPGTINQLYVFLKKILPESISQIFIVWMNRRRNLHKL